MKTRVGQSESTSENLRETLSAHRGEIVLRIVDSGRKEQFWLVPFSASQLEEWWRGQESFDSNPDGVFDEFYQLFGETPPPHRQNEFPGIFIDAEYPEGGDLWVTMADSKEHYLCELCCDSDSYLKRPDGTRIHHRGRSVAN